MIRVVCGIIYKDNKILLTRRKKEKSLGGFWEFPGGKVEDGESDKNALERELKEELNLEVYDLDFSSENIHKYDEFVIHLLGYKCKAKLDPSKLTDHDKYEWVAVSELREYNLAEADRPLLKTIEYLDSDRKL